MAPIEFVEIGDLPFVTAGEYRDSADPRVTIPDRAQEAMEIKVVHRGSATSPQLVVQKLAPHHRVEAHAHESSEIIYVLAGEIAFGSRRCPIGTAVHVPAMTLYGFTAGSQGAEILNFRGRNDVSYLTPAELRARLGQPGTS